MSQWTAHATELLDGIRLCSGWGSQRSCFEDFRSDPDQAAGYESVNTIGRSVGVDLPGPSLSSLLPDSSCQGQP